MEENYADVNATELRRRKMLEDAERAIQADVAELTLEKQTCRRLPKKYMKLPSGLAARMQERFWVRVRRSCLLAVLRPSVWCAKSQARDQSASRRRIRETAVNRPNFGHLRACDAASPSSALRKV